METQQGLTPEQKANLLKFSSQDVASKGEERRVAEALRLKTLAEEQKAVKEKVVIDDTPMKKASVEDDRGSLTGRNPEDVVIGKREDFRTIN
jgi:hypothetical protein